MWLRCDRALKEHTVQPPKSRDLWLLFLWDSMFKRLQSHRQTQKLGHSVLSCKTLRPLPSLSGPQLREQLHHQWTLYDFMLLNGKSQVCGDPGWLQLCRQVLIRNGNSPRGEVPTSTGRTEEQMISCERSAEVMSRRQCLGEPAVIRSVLEVIFFFCSPPSLLRRNMEKQQQPTGSQHLWKCDQSV